jgi:hypothetical protein
MTGSNTIGIPGCSARRRSSRAATCSAANHADLDRVDSDIADNSFNLRENHLGRDRMDGADADRVLRRDRRDGRHRVTAEHRDRLDIGLNAGAAAGIGTGNDENPGRRRHTPRLRPAPGREVFHVHGAVM